MTAQKRASDHLIRKGLKLKPNLGHLVAVLLAFGGPSQAENATFEETLRFCKLSQMLVPIFLERGNITGQSVCKTAGRPDYECGSSISLGAGICLAGERATYECNSTISLGAGVCLAGDRATYECNSSMSLGAGVCLASGRATYECNSNMRYAKGVCLAGGLPTYECTDSLSLGAAVCRLGGNAGYECSGIGDEDLGEGICRALGGNSYQCSDMSVSEAICGFTGNCRDFDAASIAVSMVETCGVEVLRYGLESW